MCLKYGIGTTEVLLISKFEWLYSRPVCCKSHGDTAVRKVITNKIYLLLNRTDG